MTESNWLCFVAKRARECHSNYIIAPSGTQTVEGTSFQSTVRQLPPEARVSTVYTFFEPSAEDLLVAEAAGIRVVYFAVSKHDAARFAHRVRTQTIQRAREWVLENHVAKWSANDPTIPRDTDPGPEREDAVTESVQTVQNDTQG